VREREKERKGEGKYRISEKYFITYFSKFPSENERSDLSLKKCVI